MQLHDKIGKLNHKECTQLWIKYLLYVFTGALIFYDVLFMIQHLNSLVIQCRTTKKNAASLVAKIRE